jgi:hypothetical protein
MEAMRQSWTDDRLDDLSRRMDERFDKVEGEMKIQGRELRAEIKGQGEELRGEIKGLGKELRDEMAGMEARLRAQASEHYVRTGEEFGKLRQEMRNDRQQLLGETQALQRTIIQIGWTGAITLIAAVAGMLIAQLF